MSPSRRRKSPDLKKPRLEEELAELQPDDATGGPTGDAAELPTLSLDDAIDEAASPVKVSCAVATEPGFDTVVAVAVPAMEKKAVADAVTGPLRRAVEQHAASLRLRNVLVDFPGEALIGTAVKDLVGTIMAPKKPLKVVVRRGYGDEVVHEGAMPRVDVATRVDGDVVHVEVGAGDVDAEDLPAVLASEVTKVTALARGKRVAIAMTGGKGADLTEIWRDALATAGALRATLGDAVLFDRALEARVRLRVSDGGTTIDVTPADAEAETIAAFDLVLRANTKQLARHNVRARFAGRPPRPAELDRLAQICRAAECARLEVGADGGEVDVLWPRLLELAQRDGGVTLSVRPGGRSPRALAIAFRRECDAITPRLLGQQLTVDWPAGCELDAALEQTMLDALAAHAPRSVNCTFDGGAREPYMPVPLALVTEPDGRRTVRVDAESHKPADLVRAIERRLRLAAASLRGQRVHIEVKGKAVPSRTVVRALRDECGRAGATRVEIDEQGAIDVLVPPLLTIDTSAADVVRVAADAGGRDVAQVDKALGRELEAAAVPASATWTLAPSPVTDTLVAALVARGVARVVVEGPVALQVHPRLFAAAEREDQRLTLRANPGPDAATTLAQIEHELPALLAGADLAAVAVTVVWPEGSDPKAEPLNQLLAAIIAAKPHKVLLHDGGRGRPRQVFPEVVPDYVRLLGRKDDPAAPLLLVGIDAGAGDEHVARVLAKLETIGGQIDGRRVLLVLRRDDADLPANAADPLIVAVRAAIDSRAAATLLFRGRDPQTQRAFFVVVHSRVPGMSVGTRFADPRRPGA